VPGVAFVSVQKGPATAQMAAYKGTAPLLNLDAQIQDFEDTIAILSAVDLLVSVDTSVVHFAGALGRPAWAMIPFAPDWRWLMNREDTPWYPSVRLFRHPQPKRWDLVIPRVAEELARFAGR
jgi:ADP-heptose:LPS heptosyltransferase